MAEELPKLPTHLLWAVAKLLELDERGATGNLTIALKPGSNPRVRFEEVFAEQQAGTSRPR